MGRRKSKFRHRKLKMGKEIPATIASSSAPPPPWIELPEDITANILKRLGAVEILKSAQKVCTTWRKVSHDPSMWRVIDLRNPEHFMEQYDLICRQAVDRSQGQLVDLSLTYFGDDELINYVAYRSSHLKHLTLQDCIDISGEGLVEAVKKLPHLEELHLIIMPTVQAEDIINIGISCPMLKSFSFNDRGSKQPIPEHYFTEEDEFTESSNEFGQAIASSMPNLCHLSLFANWMKNEGLEAILDSCPHLESLDLRQCFRLDLKQGALGKRCSEQIKHVKYPKDSISDIKWVVDWGAAHLYGSPFSDYDSLDDYGYYDDLGDYDDYFNPFNDISFLGEDVPPWIFDHGYF
ncbi:hypothetical protein ACS0TY_032493 [Phlomoides rotata]